MRHSRSRGFTLIELMVAVVASGLVLLGARAVADTVTLATDRARAQGALSARDAAARRTLRLLVSRVEVALHDSQTVAGDSLAVRFTSWCDTPFGWLERCAVRLAVASAGDSATLEITGGTRPQALATIPLARRATLRYLRSADGGGEWAPRWQSSLRAPLAIEVDAGADTLFLLLGQRG